MLTIKNKKVKILVLANLMLSVTLFFSGCSITPDKEGHSGFLFNKDLREVKVYFTKSKKSDELLFITAARKVSKDDSAVSAALKELFLGPTKSEELMGIMTEIPIGTRLIKVEESEDEVLVDLSSQYLTGGGSAAMQLRYLQIYKTLKKLCPNKEIYLNVEGKSLKTIGGEGLEVSQPIKNINDYTKKYEKTKDLQP